MVLLSELQTGHSNQCVKLKYLITTWMGADSAAALKDAVLPWYYITWIGNAVHYSLVPRPSPAPVFDRLQYAKTEPEGLVNLTT